MVYLGSLEYAVEHLGVRLGDVIGYKRCGAVGVAVQGGEAPGHIRSLVEAITPAVKKCSDLGVDAVAKENVRKRWNKSKAVPSL